MEGEGAACVGSRHQHYPAPVHFGERFHNLGEGGDILGALARGVGTEQRLLQAALLRWRHVIDIVKRAWVRLAVERGEAELMDPDSRFVRHLFGHHAIECRRNLRPVHINRREALHRGEAEQRSRVFTGIENPAEHQLIDMGDLVIARRDHRICARESGNVPGNAQATAVCFGGHRRNPGRVHRIVDLDLPVSARGIPAHRINRFGFSRGKNAISRRKRALALDKTAACHARASNFTLADALDQFIEHRVVVAHIAHRSDTGEHVEQRIFLPQMGMGIGEAGDQRAEIALDHGFTG